jgi:hypothetical protein
MYANSLGFVTFSADFTFIKICKSAPVAFAMSVSVRT